MLALALFVLTLALVVWQPRGLGIGWSACLGAGLALLTGVIRPADIPVVWGIVWNATGTFVAVVIISLLLEAAGFFEWAALHMARWGGGRGGRLFVLMVLLGAGVSALFNNDGAALILTPIVVAMLAALRFSPRATLAFVMAAGFIADTASLPLVVSNLVNIVTADYFGIGFARYAAIMAPVDLAAILASLAVLGGVFRRAIPARYDVQRLPAPATAVRDRPTFRAGWGVLAWLLLGFFVLEPLGIPVSATAAAGALALALVAARGGRIPVLRRVRGAPWQIIVFALGMYLVVYGLRHAGLTGFLTQALDWLAGQGVWTATLGTGLLSAVLSSLMNNLPTVLIGALSIEASQAQGVVREAMVYAHVIGCDLGPKLTPIGSLATLLWLHVLRGRDIRIGWGQYCRMGLALTLPVLAAALAALAWRIG
ncbi:arsenic transporter [Castellaniella defragrans]|uniref:Arsenical pump membrane protein n=2 Tax=Castellaniella defragrans TaxID=75697 RepID=W8WY46_CASD6|nr:arsenical pump membrane protein [Castellaniella defragrans]CDM24514.1 Arsenic efflux pump protein [Castellaniella defragrans 65Phen]